MESEVAQPSKERGVNERRDDWKRRVIVEAATTIFLRNGYRGTSMDEVAALAAVSKQTVYGHFADKKRLFTKVIVETTVAITADLTDVVSHALDRSLDAEATLRVLADQLLTVLLRPEVVALRRLVIAEAERDPDVAQAWFERGFAASVDQLGAALQNMADRGQLDHIGDASIAANHFAGLVVYTPMNRVMFCGQHAGATPPEERDQIVEAAVRVFLAAYGIPVGSARRPSRQRRTATISGGSAV